MKDLWRWLRELLQPTLRKARRKRQLEQALRAAGVSRSQASRVVALYFTAGRKGTDHGY